MVGFQDQDIGVSDSLENQPRGVAEVGKKADVSLSGLEQESNRILRIMRDTEGLDGQILEVKDGSSGEEPTVEPDPQLIFQGLFGGSIAVNGNSQLLPQLRQTLDMVGMLMGNQNPGKAFWSPAEEGEAFADLAQTQARIDEEPRLWSLQVSTVARRTAG